MARKGKQGVVGKIGGEVERVTLEETRELVKLRAVRDEAELTARKHALAYESAALAYFEVERAVAKKYRLNTGDAVNADGTIVRGAAKAAE